jgi:outer membrane protein assembly factor BamB
MKKDFNRTKTASLTLILLLAISALIIALPIAVAQDDHETVILYACLSAAPSTVGVGQPVYLSFWLDKVPPTANVQYGDRWENLEVVVTKPDSSETTLGPFTTDNIGGAYTVYYPDSIGTYTFQFFFPGQTIEGKNPAPTGTLNSFRVGDYYLPAASTPEQVEVQADPVTGRPATPFPTDEYWDRPVNGMNPEWQPYVGDWLNVDPGANSFVQFTKAPESAHVMWTDPIAPSGVCGGDAPNWNYYSGLAYETKFGTPIIMNGKLIYDLPLGTSGGGGGTKCVDLRTGEELWYLDDVDSLNFGQNLDYQTPNEFGIKPYIWKTSGLQVSPGAGLPPLSAWGVYDPWTGELLYSFVNASSGTTVTGPNGEILVYRLDNNREYLSMWNSTKCIADNLGGNAWTWRPNGRTFDWRLGIQWNVTINSYSGPSGQSIWRIADDVILATTRASWAPRDYTQVIGYSAVDGRELWYANRTPPPGHIISWNTYQGSPAGEGVFVEFYPETREFYGYDTHTGAKIWGPTEPLPDAFSIYTWQARIAYGKLFVPDYGGYMHAFDVHTGEKLWSYFLGDAGYDTPYGHYPIETPMIVADEKVYGSSGHGYSPPLFKGAALTCVDANDGSLVWDILFYGCRMGMAAADGYLVTYNIFDGQVYCFGKGPSQTTVNAPLTGAQLGSSITITGSVTDECAGAKKLVEEGKFKSIPAISDEDMSDWMEYLYMQQPMPTDAQGVTVKLSSIDPNGNYQDIGEVTADIWGNFGISWVPPVPGLYQIVAEFEGSASYGKSSASAYFTVDQAPTAAQPIEPEQPAAPGAAFAPTEPTSAEPTQAAEAPVISTEVAIIAAIAVASIIGIVAFWALRKRK